MSQSDPRHTPSKPRPQAYISRRFSAARNRGTPVRLTDFDRTVHIPLGNCALLWTADMRSNRWPTTSLSRLHQVLRTLRVDHKHPDGRESTWRLVEASDGPGVRFPQYVLAVKWTSVVLREEVYLSLRHHRNISGSGRVGAEPIRGLSTRAHAETLTQEIRKALSSTPPAPPPHHPRAHSTTPASPVSPNAPAPLYLTYPSIHDNDGRIPPSRAYAAPLSPDDFIRGVLCPSIEPAPPGPNLPPDSPPDSPRLHDPPSSPSTDYGSATSDLEPPSPPGPL